MLEKEAGAAEPAPSASARGADGRATSAGIPTDVFPAAGMDCPGEAAGEAVAEAGAAPVEVVDGCGEAEADVGRGCELEWVGGCPLPGLEGPREVGWEGGGLTAEAGGLGVNMGRSQRNARGRRVEGLSAATMGRPCRASRRRCRSAAAWHSKPTPCMQHENVQSCSTFSRAMLRQCFSISRLQYMHIMSAPAVERYS